MKVNTNHLLFLLLSIFLFSFTLGNKKKNDWEKEHLKGEVKSIRLYYYKTADDLTMAINPFRISKSDSSYTMLINFNEYGNVIDKIANNGTKLFTCNYDSAHNLVESKEFNVNGGMTKEGVYKYDENSNLIENSGTNYYRDTVRFKLIYKYDEDGNKDEMGYYR